MKSSDQRGIALLEVMTIALVLLIPMIWLLTTLSKVHVAALAVTAAARQGAVDVSMATDVVTARSALDRAIEEALRSHGLDPQIARVSASFDGLERGASVEVSLTYPVPLLTVPFLGSVSGASLSIGGTHTATIPRYGNR